MAMAPVAVAAMSYAGPDGDLRMLGHRVQGHFVNPRRRMVCPRCLTESNHHRAVWDMSLTTLCVVHQVRLVDRCPGCGKPLSWKVPSPSACRCGHDLRWDAGESVPEGELAGAAAVHRMLHTPPDRLEGLAAQVGVGGVLALVYAFGGMASGDRRSRNAVSFARLHPERAHLLVDAGWWACADWPSSFHGLLERLRTRASERKGRYGIAKEFGRLHDWLSDIGDQTYGRVALKAFADHVAARPELATRAPVVLRRRAEAPPEHTGMTLMQAARLLNVAFETLRRHVDRHGLALAGGGGKGAPVLLRASVVRTLKAEMARLVDQDAAWHLLGMGKRTFVELRDTDLLPLPVPGADVLPPPAWPLAADLFGRPVWAVADLETFVRRFDAAVVRRRGGGHLIGLPTVARMLSGLGLGMEQVLRAVLDGRLRPISLTMGKRGLARLAFRREDAVALQKAIATEKRGTLSVNRGRQDTRRKAGGRLPVGPARSAAHRARSGQAR